MPEKMRTNKRQEKEFSSEEFYRRLGVWLLTLLLFLIIVFGSAMLIIQKQILDQTNPNFVNKSSVKVLDLEEDENIELP